MTKVMHWICDVCGHKIAHGQENRLRISAWRGGELSVIVYAELCDVCAPTIIERVTAYKGADEVNHD